MRIALAQKISISILALLLLIIPLSITAQETTEKTENPDIEHTYQTYLNLYEKYTKAYSDYLKKRTRYLTYQTLTSKNEALEATKNVIAIRDDVLISYIDLLFLANVDPDFADILFEQKAFFNSHKQEIPAIETLEDINKSNKEVSKHYNLFQSLSKQVIGSIYLKKIDSLTLKVKVFELNVNTLIDDLSKNGLDVRVLERWKIDAKNKLELGYQNLEVAKLNITNIHKLGAESANTTLNSARNRLYTTNQYFKEASDLYHEILEEIKYGDF